jgi:hypothetical protein
LWFMFPFAGMGSRSALAGSLSTPAFFLGVDGDERGGLTLEDDLISSDPPSAFLAIVLAFADRTLVCDITEDESDDFLV